MRTALLPSSIRVVLFEGKNFALNGKANQLHTRVIEADDIVLVDIEVALCGRGSRRSAVLTRSRGNQRAAERHRWQLAYSD
jgi:hypothetical protein